MLQHLSLHARLPPSMNSQPNYRNCVQHRTLRNLRQAEQYVAGTNYELLLEMGVTKHAGSRNVILSFDGMSP